MSALVIHVLRLPVKYSDESIISSEHLSYLQQYASYVTDMTQKLGYNLAHNNVFREKAAVALDQQFYPELAIVHNNQTTGTDATDKYGRTREYKKVELGPGYKKPFERQFKQDDKSIVLKRRRGSNGYQPSKIGFQLTRFRQLETQQHFITHDALVISLFFSEVALPSISYVIRSETNLKKIVAFYNNVLYNTPYGSNKWSHNNVKIPIMWLLTELDTEYIDVIVMVDNIHRRISVVDHNTNYIGLDLTPSGFIMVGPT